MSHFARTFAMPNRATFSIPQVRSWISLFVEHPDAVIVDPFAMDSQIATVRNDLRPETAAEHHGDAREFLHGLATSGLVADVLLLDPPYSPRQISECYRSIGREVRKKDTQNSRFMREVRDAAMGVIRKGSIVLSFGWNSVGMGTSAERLSTLLVCHGGAHNDTICVADRIR